MRVWCLISCLVGVACGSDDAPPVVGCPTPPVLAPAGDPNGHPEPLGAGATEARAGRVTAADLPAVPSGLITWAEGDFVLANDRVALVIEDVGDSDLYDPWGGRPVGLARMQGGAMIEPNDFGELFLLTGRSTLVTDRVTVVADGRDGGAAVVRAHGRLHPLPFFEAVTGAVFSDALDDLEAELDYRLEPGAEWVDVVFRYASPREVDAELATVMHALMFTRRTPAFVPGEGFAEDLGGASYLALVDDNATSWAYAPAAPFEGGVSVSGFLGGFSGSRTIPACAVSEAPHARILIGDRDGLDGVVAAAGRWLGEPTRVVTGTVTVGGQVARGARVHATLPNGDYLTRATTDSEGAFSLHVPAAATVTLHAYRRGSAVVTAPASSGAQDLTLDLAPVGQIRVEATEVGGGPLPVRVQVRAAAGQVVPALPEAFGEPTAGNGRLHVEFATTGTIVLPVPAGQWDVIVSRGYEYELHEETVTVTAGATTLVEPALERVVATPQTLCADFHIHTARSNDAADTGLRKLAGAVADGLELPVRSEHEFVADFAAEIEELQVGAWAAGFASIELTSFEVWGHMGVFPLVPDATRPNAGAPKWQTFPTAAAPDTPFVTLDPPAVFDAVRARPEAPVVIINHPRGGANYFERVGYDPATGMVEEDALWDTAFTLVEVFNDSGWRANRDDNVRDWLSIVAAGRKVFAVGSSDSHGIASSPVGYPRTCIEVGTDDPAVATATAVRDALAAGHTTISGGIYVDASIGAAGPGDTASGLGATATVALEIQAASWIDVDAFDVVVDGVTVDTVPILPGDADPQDPTVRWRGNVPIDVAAHGRGFVVIAAYGDAALEPVHPGRLPFGVAGPIFVTP